MNGIRNIHVGAVSPTFSYISGGVMRRPTYAPLEHPIGAKRRSDHPVPKRLCIACHRLYVGEEVSIRLKGYRCVCVGCSDAEYIGQRPTDAGSTGDGTSCETEPRYSGVL